MEQEQYEDLAIAIIKQAATDYMDAMRILSNKKYRGTKRYWYAKATKYECLRFFNSNDFKLYTNIDPGYLIARLNENYGEKRNQVYAKCNR